MLPITLLSRRTVSRLAGVQSYAPLSTPLLPGLPSSALRTICTSLRPPHLQVVTAQYFIWYLSLLPLVLPSSAAFTAAERPRALALAAGWLVCLLSWLATAYRLEFRSQPVFLYLWASRCVCASHIAARFSASMVSPPSSSAYTPPATARWHPRSLAFLAMNVVLIHQALRWHHATPLFRRGVRVKQRCLYGALPRPTSPPAASETAPAAPLPAAVCADSKGSSARRVGVKGSPARRAAVERSINTRARSRARHSSG